MVSKQEKIPTVFDGMSDGEVSDYVSDADNGSDDSDDKQTPSKILPPPVPSSGQETKKNQSHCVPNSQSKVTIKTFSPHAMGGHRLRTKYITHGQRSFQHNYKQSRSSAYQPFKMRPRLQLVKNPHDNRDVHHNPNSMKVFPTQSIPLEISYLESTFHGHNEGLFRHFSSRLDLIKSRDKNLAVLIDTEIDIFKSFLKRKTNTMFNQFEKKLLHLVDTEDLRMP